MVELKDIDMAINDVSFSISEFVVDSVQQAPVPSSLQAYAARRRRRIEGYEEARSLESFHCTQVVANVALKDMIECPFSRAKPRDLGSAERRESGKLLLGDKDALRLQMYHLRSYLSLPTVAALVYTSSLPLALRLRRAPSPSLVALDVLQSLPALSASVERSKWIDHRVMPASGP